MSQELLDRIAELETALEDSCRRARAVTDFSAGSAFKASLEHAEKQIETLRGRLQDKDRVINMMSRNAERLCLMVKRERLKTRIAGMRAEIAKIDRQLGE